MTQRYIEHVGTGKPCVKQLHACTEHIPLYCLEFCCFPVSLYLTDSFETFLNPFIGRLLVISSILTSTVVSMEILHEVGLVDGVYLCDAPVF